MATHAAAAVPGTYTKLSNLSTEKLIGFLEAHPQPRAERAEEAWELPGATRFSKDRRLRDPAWLVSEIQKHPEIWRDLERETTEPLTYAKRKTGRKAGVGRDRMAGHWGLIACAWIISKQTDIQTFLDYNRANDFWRRAGFTSAPSYSATWERLSELAYYADGYIHASQKLWRLAAFRDERVCRHIHADGTAVQTHAQLVHDCQDPEWCAANGGKEMPKRIEIASPEQADERRQQFNQKPVREALVELEEETGSGAADSESPEEQIVAELDEESEILGEAQSATIVAVQRRRGLTRRPQIAPDSGRELWIRRSKTGPRHRYTSRDRSAGFRIYTISPRKIKVIYGYLNMRLIDDYTGAEIVSLHIPADQAEHKHLSELLDRFYHLLGFYPEVVTADRGYAVRETRLELAEREIALITPFRRPNHNITKREQLAREGDFDGYGLCYCQHCGSPGTDHDFDLNAKGEPRMTFLCGMPLEPGCQRRQNRLFKDEPLLFSLVPKDHPLYWELRDVGKSFERGHRLARQRYTTGANNLDTRPKRVGIEFLEMRSRISHFVEVFRLCLRNGWLGDHEQKNEAQPRRRKKGEKLLQKFTRIRKAKGLLLPQGPAAKKLHLVWDGTVPKGWTLLKDKRAKAKANRSEAAKAREAKKKLKTKGGQVSNAGSSEGDEASDRLALPPISAETPF